MTSSPALFPDARPSGKVELPGAATLPASRSGDTTGGGECFSTVMDQAAGQNAGSDAGEAVSTLAPVKPAGLYRVVFPMDPRAANVAPFHAEAFPPTASATLIAKDEGATKLDPPVADDAEEPTTGAAPTPAPTLDWSGQYGALVGAVPVPPPTVPLPIPTPSRGETGTAATPATPANAATGEVRNELPRVTSEPSVGAWVPFASRVIRAPSPISHPAPMIKRGEAPPEMPEAGTDHTAAAGTPQPTRGGIDVMQLGLQPLTAAEASPTAGRAKLDVPSSLVERPDGALVPAHGKSPEVMHPQASTPTRQSSLTPTPQPSANAGDDLRFTNDDLRAPWPVGSSIENRKSEIFVSSGARLELPTALEDPAKNDPAPLPPPGPNVTPAEVATSIWKPVGKGLVKVSSQALPTEWSDGTAVAKQPLRMENLNYAEAGGAAPENILPGKDARLSGLLDNSAADRAVDASASLTVEKDSPTDRTGATEWPMGRPVDRIDRPASDSNHAPAPEPAGRVEEISRLLARETSLVRLHQTDSMAVILRPDADTELFVHLTKSNGHVEVSVRCERGDYQQLNQLWSQLQESLAPQKVRLAPLQEADAPATPGANSFSNSGGTSPHGGRQQRQTRPDTESLAEWPPSASKPERSGRGSGERLTTSRPGWETWA